MPTRTLSVILQVSLQIPPDPSDRPDLFCGEVCPKFAAKRYVPVSRSQVGFCQFYSHIIWILWVLWISIRFHQMPLDSLLSDNTEVCWGGSSLFEGSIWSFKRIKFPQMALDCFKDQMVVLTTSKHWNQLNTHIVFLSNYS